MYSRSDKRRLAPLIHNHRRRTRCHDVPTSAELSSTDRSSQRMYSKRKKEKRRRRKERGGGREKEASARARRGAGAATDLRMRITRSGCTYVGEAVTYTALCG